MSKPTLEQYFGAMRSHEWQRLAGCLAADVVRTGPFLDVVRGREAYVSFLSKVVPTLKNYQLEVLRIHETLDGSAFVELRETLDVDGQSTTFPEGIFFAFDDRERIREVSVYLQRPPGS